MSPSSAGLKMGVAPPSSMFASLGPGTRRQYSSISAALRGASRKVMSAPASRKARQRSTASSSPSVPRASVRARMSMSSPAASRASTAARIRATAWSRGTTALGATCPQRLGITWSSSMMPARPARMYASTVRATLSGCPPPVSPSPMQGTRRRADVTTEAWDASSAVERSCVSGTPLAALMPKPVANVRLNPASSTSRAVRPS
mmetsp:Transcript_8078/g.27488  ORF Transcript_8078/g.27488 Transcript_8078/m.27488 type:complete len:204 (-) Transcript_8078:213-824(-)